MPKVREGLDEYVFNFGLEEEGDIFLEFAKNEKGRLFRRHRTDRFFVFGLFFLTLCLVLF